METDIITFEAVDERGTGWYDFLFFASGSCLIIGSLVFVISANPHRWMVSAPLIIFGIAAFCWLLRRLPKTNYFIYFRVDTSGIHYKETPNSRVKMTPWNLIAGVKAARYPAGEGEQSGIELAVLSTSGHGDTQFLPMPMYQVDQALPYIRETMLRQRTASNHRIESDAGARLTRTR